MIHPVVKSMRVPFLALTPVSVLLGVSIALEQSSELSYFKIVLVLLGAIFLHISVNTFNEYYDFRSGLDSKTTRTPFSGGSGALVEFPAYAHTVLTVAVVSLLLAIGIGSYFVYETGFATLLIGLLGVLIIVTYTNEINRVPILCLLAPGVGFGPLMVGGSYVALTGTISINVLIISLIPFCLANNLLLLNQFPDVEADKSVGRRHFPIIWGLQKSLTIYLVFVLLALSTLLISIVYRILPPLSSLCVLTIALLIFVYFRMKKYLSEPQHWPQYLGVNVIATLTTPIVISVAILLA